MTSSDEPSNSISPRPDRGSTIDRRTASRAARLLRWYPKDWRARYGDEFEAVLSSSLSDGKGGLRLSLNVAREGVVARLESGGFVGRSAPPLDRARASVLTIVAAILGFLTTTAVLAYYEKGWQRTPALEAVHKAIQAFTHTKANRTYEQWLGSPAFHRLQLAAFRAHSPTSPAFTALERAQNQAANILNNSRAGRALEGALHHLPTVSTTSDVFNDIAHVGTDAAIACLGVALVVATATGVRLTLRGNGKRLLFPISFLLGSGVLFVLSEVAYQAFQKIPPGQPGSEWTTLKWVVADGNYRFWPVVVFPVCTAASIVFAVVGGVKLVRRVEFGPRLYLVLGSVARIAAGCLSVVLVSTLLWVATVYAQAPGFLTSKDQGVLGSSLLPVFIVAVLVMSGTCWLVGVCSNRCLRNVRAL
jgi:hypothetical protein